MERKGTSVFAAKAFGQFMRLIREGRNMSVEAGARRVGISEKRLRRIEAGKAEVRTDEWVAFCRAMQLTPWGEPSIIYWRRFNVWVKGRDWGKLRTMCGK